jgi:hypothetical protein
VGQKDGVIMIKITAATKRLALSLGLVTLFGAALAAADSPFIGTWKMNSEKSTFAVGAPRLLFATMKIENTANGLRTTVSEADGDGRANDHASVSAWDGTWTDVISSPSVDKTSVKKIDDHTITVAATKDGKEVYTDRRTVSADGKTITILRSGTTSDGMKYQNTITFDRAVPQSDSGD